MSELLKALLSVPTAAGAEQGMRAFLSERIAPYVDSVETDRFGNLIACRRARLQPDGEKKETLAFVCAMDHPGRVVTYVEPNGLLRTASVGSLDAARAAYSRVTASELTGVLVPDPKGGAGELLADFGFSDAEHARLRPGDILCYGDAPLTLADGSVYAPALGNKLCLAALLESAEKATDVPFDVYYLFCAQSTLGNRGAYPAAFAVMPTHAVCLAPYEKESGTLGVGLLDKTMVCDRELTDALIDAASACGVSLDAHVNDTAMSDAARIQGVGSGVRTGLLLLPVTHSGAVCQKAHPDTVDVAVCVTEAFLKSR